MRADRYGLAVSTTSAAARDAYVAGVDCVLAAQAGGAGRLRAGRPEAARVLIGSRVERRAPVLLAGYAQG
jgi:hypothetical protein